MCNRPHSAGSHSQRPLRVLGMVPLSRAGDDSTPLEKRFLRTGSDKGCCAADDHLGARAGRGGAAALAREVTVHLLCFFLKAPRRTRRCGSSTSRSGREACTSSSSPRGGRALLRAARDRGGGRGGGWHARDVPIGAPRRGRPLAGVRGRAGRRRARPRRRATGRSGGRFRNDGDELAGEIRRESSRVIESCRD